MTTFFQIEKDFAYLKQLCSDSGSYTKLEEDPYDMEKIKLEIEKAEKEEEDKGTLFWKIKKKYLIILLQDSLFYIAARFALINKTNFLSHRVFASLEKDHFRTAWKF